MSLCRSNNRGNGTGYTRLQGEAQASLPSLRPQSCTLPTHRTYKCRSSSRLRGVGQACPLPRSEVKIDLGERVFLHVEIAIYRTIMVLCPP